MEDDRVKAIREPKACAKCLAVHSRKDPGGADVEKQFPLHLKAVCWAYHCDDCADIVIGALLHQVAYEPSDE